MKTRTSSLGQVLTYAFAAKTSTWQLPDHVLGFLSDRDVSNTSSSISLDVKNRKLGVGADSIPLFGNREIPLSAA